MGREAEVWVELAFPDLPLGRGREVWRAIQKRAANCGNLRTRDDQGHPASVIESETQFQRLLGVAPSARLTNLAVGSIVIPVAHIRAAREGDYEWVELCFPARSVQRDLWSSISEQYHTFAKSVSREVGVTRFEAGVDNSEDPTLQLFTNDRFGPVVLDEGGVRWGNQ